MDEKKPAREREGWRAEAWPVGEGKFRGGGMLFSLFHPQEGSWLRYFKAMLILAPTLFSTLCRDGA